MTNWHNEVCNQENKSLPTITTSDMNLPCQSQFHHKLSTPHEASHSNQHLVISAEINIDPPVENQHSFGGTIQTNYSPTDTIDQDIKDQQVYKEQVLNHNQNFCKQEKNQPKLNRPLPMQSKDI